MKRLALEGLEVTVSRSEEDGVFLVLIDSSEVKKSDQFDSGVPKLKLMVNDSIDELQENGEWKIIG